MSAYRFRSLAKICSYLYALVVIAFSLMLLPTAAGAQTPGTFSQTGEMSIQRNSGAAARLLNGQVLFAGGEDESGPRGTAELYNPDSGTFSPTDSMILARAWNTGTLLTNGKVLITGGRDNNYVVQNTAELYDPSSGTFSYTGNMTTPRWNQQAVRLADGRVLIIGGIDSGNNVLASAEIYDPASGSFTPTGSMTTPRVAFSATLLLNGEVLVAGGSKSISENQTNDLGTAELYDPATGAFSATGHLGVASRVGQAATFLNDGRVLLSGGAVDGEPSNTAEIYDPSQGTFSSNGATMADPHSSPAAALLADGRVLIVGGATNNTGASLPSTAIYDPSTESFSSGPDTLDPYNGPFAIALNNGTFLIAGGDIPSGPNAGTGAAEIYTPASIPTARIARPINGAVVQNTAILVIQVSSQVLWINVYVDGRYLTSSPPYNFTWDSTSVSDGSHTISIKAFNSSDRQIGDNSVTVTVDNAASSSAVTITSPSNGSSVSGTATITARTTSSVDWINVYIDGSYFASSPPDTFSWNSTTVSNGSHTISAKAFNASDQQIGSDSVTVNVLN